MAWQLLNRVYTVGTVDGSGDISPGTAQEGFSDFTGLSSNNETYIVAFQGEDWSFMRVRKVGAILRPQATIDSSNGGASISFDTGQQISVFTDVGAQKLVYIDGDNNVQNADIIFNSLAPNLLTDLKALPLPSSGETVRYLRNILANDRKAAFYVWKPAEATAGDDFNFVVSNNSATGRWVRQKPIIEVPSLANDAASYNSSVYAVSDDLRFKNSAGLVKKLPRVENFKQGSYATLAALKAAVSTQFANGDTAELRGRIADGDLLAPLTVTWVAASTNTDALDIKFVRPDDVSGANAGRWEIPTPVIAIKFDNSDATPSVKNGVLFTCADTAPGTITTFDDMRDGQWVTVQPGAQNQVFAHSGTFVMPGGANFTLRTNDGPIRFYKENGTIRLVGTVSLTDGDKGDITVSSNGATWTIDAEAISTAKIADDAVTFDKLLNATQAAFIGATGAGAFGERTYAQVRADLGLVIGTDVQAYDADLAAIAGLTSAADKGIQFTGSGTAGTFDLTAAGKALLDDADATAQRATLGLGALAVKSTVATAEIDANAVTFPKFQQATVTQRIVGRNTAGGGDYEQITLSQALDWVSATENAFLYRGAATWGAGTITAAGRALVDDADASAQRTTLGLVIGTDVQAYDAQLDSLAALSYTSNGLKVVRVNAGETAFELATLSGGGDALVANPLSQFAATTSSQLAGVISDETGSGVLVFGTSPTLTTPTINGGTIQSRVQTSSETTGVLTSASANKTVNCTGGITINNSVFTAGDIILVYAGDASRTLTQGSGVTMRLGGSATTGNRTLAIRGVAMLYFVSASEVVVSGGAVT